MANVAAAELGLIFDSVWLTFDLATVVALMSLGYAADLI